MIRPQKCDNLRANLSFRNSQLGGLIVHNIKKRNRTIGRPIRRFSSDSSRSGNTDGAGTSMPGTLPEVYFPKDHSLSLSLRITLYRWSRPLAVSLSSSLYLSSVHSLVHPISPPLFFSIPISSTSSLKAIRLQDVSYYIYLIKGISSFDETFTLIKNFFIWEALCYISCMTSKLTNQSLRRGFWSLQGHLWIQSEITYNSWLYFTNIKGCEIWDLKF